MIIGPYELSFLRDGSIHLDGGGMFGVVPRVLWERRHVPDELNRVELALHCLLLRGEGRVILVDCGMGDGWSKKEREMFGLHRSGGGLPEALAGEGVACEDVTDVVLTHLHFDHVGGAVVHRDGEWRPRFPNATHWVQAQNLHWAEDPSDRDRASYQHRRWEVLQREDGRLRSVEGPGEILPHLQVLVVNGHTPGQQLVLVGEEGAPRLLHGGDLIPFASHLRLSWAMAFDLNPLITLNEKKQWLARAAAEGWTFLFGHDPEIPLGTVKAENGDFALDEVVEA